MARGPHMDGKAMAWDLLDGASQQDGWINEGCCGGRGRITGAQCYICGELWE